jgi:hypothetical protein
MAAALGTTTAPATAAYVASWGDQRWQPRHRVASGRCCGVSTRLWRLRASNSSSPAAVTAGAPDEATAVSVPWAKTLGFIPLTVQQLHQPAPFSLRRARTSPCFFFQGTINSSEKWLSCSGTFGGGTGVGLGDKAKEAGVSNLLLSPVQLERSVGVSGLAIFLRVIIQLLVAQLFIRLMACSFPVLFPVSSARPARNPTPISKSTGTLQWLLGQPSTLSPCLRRQSFSGILFSSKMS